MLYFGPPWDPSGEGILGTPNFRKGVTGYPLEGRQGPLYFPFQREEKLEPFIRPGENFPSLGKRDEGKEFQKSLFQETNLFRKGDYSSMELVK
jgi:hypothetical protein